MKPAMKPAIKFPTYTKTEQIARGLWTWANPKNKIRVLVWHYSANPDNTIAVMENKKRGMAPDAWRKEMEIDFEVEGDYKAIFAKYFTDEHIKPLEYDPNLPVFRGIDFGYVHPACVWLQIDPNTTQVRILHESLGENILLDDWIRNHIIPASNSKFPKAKFRDICDIAGKQRSDKSGMTSIQTLENYGLSPEYKLSLFKEGIYIIEIKLTSRAENGEPLLLIDPMCQMLIEGFRGGYRWDKDGERAKYSTFCHLMDALRYVLTMEFSAVSVVTPNRPSPSPPLTEWEIIRRMFGVAEQQAEERKKEWERREIWE